MSDEHENLPDEETMDLTSNQTKKKRKRKRFIWLGVIAVVLVGGVTGGVIWHEQPSFCAAICHSPMDPYYEGYISEDSSLLVTAHADEGNTCLDCHTASVDEQLNEAVAWVSGNYQDPLEFREIGTKSMCLECHDSYQALGELTADYPSERNPHSSHQGALECNDCHRVHQPSVLECRECHTDMELPEGWKDEKDLS